MTIGRPQMYKEIKGYQAGGIAGLPYAASVANFENPLLAGNPSLTVPKPPPMKSLLPTRPLPTAPLKPYSALDDIADEREDVTPPRATAAQIKDLEEELSEFSKNEEKSFDFDGSYEKYKKRLAPFFSEAIRPSFYDLASDLGAAMLSADPTAGAFRSMGTGFSNFSKRMSKNKKDRAAIDRQVGLKALEMAMTDERAAQEYLNRRDLEVIKLSQKPYDPLIYEVPVKDPSTGEMTIQTIEVNPSNPYEVAAIREMPGAKQTKLPTSAVTIDSRPYTETTRDKEAGKSLNAFETQLSENAQAGIAQNQLTSMFLYTVNKAGKDNWGKISSGTLSARKILDELGIRSDPNIDEQELALTLGTRIAMALVAQTKGAISNKEMELFIQASPSLASSYEGAIKQAAYLQRVANKNVEKAEAFNEAVDKGLFDNTETEPERLRKARQWEMRWARENPFFTEDERAELQEFAKKEPDVAKSFREGYFSKSSGVDSGLDTDFSGG